MATTPSMIVSFDLAWPLLLHLSCRAALQQFIEYSTVLSYFEDRSLSLSLNFITRVAPHCVNTLMILHAAHTLMMSAC